VCPGPRAGAKQVISVQLTFEESMLAKGGMDGQQQCDSSDVDA